MSNNLFQFASSELSQDAFICWCLNWLNEKEDEKGKQLKLLSMDLLKCFGEKEVLEEQEIDIKTQFHKIDILVVLKRRNRVYIIEDKTTSFEHGNQIETYKEKIREIAKGKNNILGIDENVEIKTVYFKTGFYFSSDETVQADAKVRGRDFLDILEKYQGISEILDNYCHYLDAKLEEEKRQENWKERKDGESHWDWNLTYHSISQFCFMRKIFKERDISSGRNSGGLPWTQYNILSGTLNSKTENYYDVFWRIDTSKTGPYIRLNFYNHYRDKKDERLREEHRKKYKEFLEKLHKYFQEEKYESFSTLDWNTIQSRRKNTDVDYESTLLHFDLEDYLYQRKDINNLIGAIQELTNFLQKSQKISEK